jgi:hypothetical protein
MSVERFVMNHQRQQVGSGRLTMGEVHRLLTPEPTFGLQAAGRLMVQVFPAWVQDLALLVETVEAARLATGSGHTAAVQQEDLQ